jgi:enhancer of mRNA-decapping protein 4
VSVPPRSMTALSAFGSPVEVGHREVSCAGTERTRALDITKLGRGPPQSSMEHPHSSHGNTPEVSVPPPAIAPAMQTAPPLNLVLSSSSSTFSSNKSPKGWSLRGEHVVYDVDVRRSGEAQPQLEVCRIILSNSKPVLRMGRQIAVSRRYLSYVSDETKIRIHSVDTFCRRNCAPYYIPGHTQV